MKIPVSISALALISTLTTGTANAARDYINVVGSSTVYPFSTVVAERFGKSTQFKTPKVESTGSGGGLKLFCQGVGVQFPDITNASRRIKASAELPKRSSRTLPSLVSLKLFSSIVAVDVLSSGSG